MRTLVILFALTIGIAGCSDELRQQIWPQSKQQPTSGKLPQAWTRADGQPLDVAQLEADKNFCRGEMDEANWALGNNARLHPETWGYTDTMISVYSGCMTQNGYMTAK